jgi:curved DNA-binding protein CbpA
MSREEAYEVLGLTSGATSDEILASYRRLMKKVHPDQGGTTYLAMRLNQAKDVLLS